MKPFRRPELRYDTDPAPADPDEDSVAVIEADATSLSIIVERDDDEYPEWDSDVVYVGGDRVTDDGAVWESRRWTQGDEPGVSDWGPWVRAN